MIPYSGKFSLVQNFVELPPRPSEEVFVVLNFAPVLRRDHTHHLLMRKVLHWNFRGSYSCGSWSICKKCELLHHAKISHYTVIGWSHTSLCKATSCNQLTLEVWTWAESSGVSTLIIPPPIPTLSPSPSSAGPPPPDVRGPKKVV